MAGSLEKRNLWLLLVMMMMISLLRTGTKGEDGLILKENSFNFTSQCEEDLACFYIGQIRTSKETEYMAIVSNKEMQEAVSVDNTCPFQVAYLTKEDVGWHRCQQNQNVFAPHNIPSVTPGLNLMPGNNVSLQCVFLNYVKQGDCFTQEQEQVKLMWVDEVGAAIKEDSQHLIQQQSSCDLTLTVSVNTTEKKIFRCQATVGELVGTLLKITVGGVERKKRRFIVEPAHQGGSLYMIGGAAGVAACAVSMAVVALVMKKRRTDSQLPDAQCSAPSSNVMNPDEIIYTNVVFPSGSDKVCVHECESTEYACVRY